MNIIIYFNIKEYWFAIRSVEYITKIDKIVTYFTYFLQMFNTFQKVL